MTTLAPITSRVEQARSLYRDVVNENDLFYVFFGRTQPWNAGTEVAPALTDTQSEIAEARRNILAVKKVSETDVVYLVRRIDWTSGVTYDRYDDEVDMSTKDFYVYNSSNFCIYKCLNRRDYIEGTAVVASTVEPSDTSPEKFSTADGYWWKLIYYIPESDRLKFMTNEYLPVRFFSSSVSFDCSGYVESIAVDEVGSGYTTPPTVIITGDGNGAAAYCEISLSGAITSVTMISGGTGYSYAKVEFVGGGGSGATATATLAPQDVDIGLNADIAAHAQATAGAIEFVDVVAAGTNYLPNTIFNILGDGANATVGTVTLLEGGTGNVYTVTIGDGGKGYTTAEMQTLGDGENAELKFLIAPPYGHGGNVPTELLATTIGIVVEVQDFLTDFFLSNDFRQIGLIKNLEVYDNAGKFFMEQTGDASYVLEVSNPNDYSVDDDIESYDGGTFRVVEKSGSYITLLPLYDILTINSTLYNRTTETVLGHFISIVSYPEIDYRSGDMLYLKNMLPVTRSLTQTETVKLFLSF